MTMNRFRYLRRPIGIITCCLATIGMLPAIEAVVAEDGFKPMFTDSSLTGWVRTNTPEKTWRFEDGVLYCTGKPIGEIRTERLDQWAHVRRRQAVRRDDVVAGLDQLIAVERYLHFVDAR